MYVRRDGDELVVDIHGMKEREAKFRLETLIGSCAPDIKKIVVIHGYNSGQVLKNLVRNGLEAPRIKRVLAAYNAGQSVIELKSTKRNSRRKSAKPIVASNRTKST